MTEKFRADQIGSLLRPEALLDARRGHDAGAVNLPTAGWDVHHPFGGFHESGSAFKEQGGPGLRFYIRFKTSAVRFAW